MGFQVRPIEIKDIKRFYTALCSVASERDYLLTYEPPPYKNVESFVLTNIDCNNAQYVAEWGDRIVGWADIIPLSRSSMEHVGSLGMGIERQFRGYGIGSALLKKTIKHAWGRNLKRLELEVFSDNEAAISLYKKHGYSEEGRKRYARYLDGRYQDVIIMAQYRP